MKKNIFTIVLICSIISANAQVNVNTQERMKESDSIYIKKHQETTKKIKDKIINWQKIVQTTNSGLTKEQQDFVLETFLNFIKVDASTLELFQVKSDLYQDVMKEYNALVKQTNDIIDKYNTLVEENQQLKEEIKKLKAGTKK